MWGPCVTNIYTIGVPFVVCLAVEDLGAFATPPSFRRRPRKVLGGSLEGARVAAAHGTTAVNAHSSQRTLSLLGYTAAVPAVHTSLWVCSESGRAFAPNVWRVYVVALLWAPKDAWCCLAIVHDCVFHAWFENPTSPLLDRLHARSAAVFFSLSLHGCFLVSPHTPSRLLLSVS